MSWHVAVHLFKEKCDDIPSSNRICNEYVLCAERAFVDAHILCRVEATQSADTPEHRFMFVLNSLMQCYANNGSFDVKCRNFWNLVLHKDTKYLFMALDETVHDSVNDDVLQSIVQSASMSEFIVSMVIQSLEHCCRGSSKFDIVTESDIYSVLDEVLQVVRGEGWSTALSEDYNRTFWNVLKLMDSMLQHGGHSANKCFVYSFGFFNLFIRFGVTPSKPNLSYFFGLGMTFFKFEKRFKSNRKGDIDIIQHCDTAQRFDNFMQRQCTLYNLRKDTLRLRVKKNHKKIDWST